jgi:excisionase family DNA binding protein
MDQLLSIREVSEKLSVKQSTLRAWVFQGKIPCVRLGRLVRFKEGDLARWLESAGKEQKSTCPQ